MTRNSAVTVTPASGSLTILGARIVFEPTAYDGGESSRVNFVLEASEEESKVVRTWEHCTDQPGAKALCSAITANGLKVKINKDIVWCWEDKNERLCRNHRRTRPAMPSYNGRGRGQPRTNGVRASR